MNRSVEGRDGVGCRNRGEVVSLKVVSFKVVRLKTALLALEEARDEQVSPSNHFTPKNC